MKMNMIMMKTENMSINIDDIHSNNKFICAHCSDPITYQNYSGWEAFVGDGSITQPICTFCNLIPDSHEKADEYDCDEG